MKKLFAVLAFFVSCLSLCAMDYYSPVTYKQEAWGCLVVGFKGVDVKNLGEGDTIMVSLAEEYTAEIPEQENLYCEAYLYQNDVIGLGASFSDVQLMSSQFSVGESHAISIILDNIVGIDDTSDSIYICFVTDDYENWPDISVVSLGIGKVNSTKKTDTGVVPSRWSTVYYIDFNEGNEGWNIVDKNLGGLSYVWKLDSYYGMKAETYVGGTNHETESWLISPTIDLTLATEAQVSFESARKYGDLSQMKLKITADDGATWDDLEGYVLPDGHDWYYHFSNFVDVSEYVGYKVKFAFAYYSTTSSGPTWEVLNLAVQAVVPARQEPQTVYFGLDSAFLALEENGLMYVKVNEHFRDVDVCMNSVNRSFSANASIIAPYPFCHNDHYIDIVARDSSKIFVPLALRTKRWYNTKGANNKQVLHFYYTLDGENWLDMNYYVKNDTCSLMKIPTLPANTRGIRAQLNGNSEHIGLVSFSYILLDSIETPAILAIDSVAFDDVYSCKVTTQSKDIYVSWQNLTSNITVALSGDAAFSTAVNSIVVDSINGVAKVAVKYSPEVLGEHTATLTFTSEGAEPVSVVLTGRYAETLSTRINTIEDDVVVEARNGRVYADRDFRIYDVLGRDVTRINGTLNGIYVVKFENSAIKVTVSK